MKTLPCALLLPGLLAIGAFAFAGEAPELPDGAIQLRNTYNLAIEAATKPIQERYLADIKKLQEQATRAGKLADALALRREMDRIIARKFIGRWAASEGTVTIQSDGTAHHSNGDLGTWQVEDTRVVLKWSNGFVHHYPLADTGDKIHGKAITPDGKTTDYILTRLP